MDWFEIILKVLAALGLLAGVFMPSIAALIKAIKAFINIARDAWEDEHISRDEWVWIMEGALEVFVASLPLWVPAKYKKRLGEFKQQAKQEAK